MRNNRCIRRTTLCVVMLATLATPTPSASQNPGGGLFGRLFGFGDSESTPGDLDPEKVRGAIDGAVRFLKRRQKNRADGWEVTIAEKHAGGPTALVALALLNAGVPPDDSVVALALDWLARQDLRHTYPLALQTMVLAQADPVAYGLKLQQNVKQLEKMQVKRGRKRGGWGYSEADNGATELGYGGDNSNSQFALLALYEAERASRRALGQNLVSESTWEAAKEYWLNGQNPDGSWGYPFDAADGHSGSGTGSMTCAGVASLVIADDMLTPPNAVVQGDEILCCQPAGDEPAITRGRDWLARHFSVDRNPGQQGLWHLYYLYALERVGRLTNERFMGDHDWYREGADYLINRKPPDRLEGFWVNDYQTGQGEDIPIIGTSMALLFLSKGRRPVVIGKLQHEPDEDWNRHRGDVAKLVRYTEEAWKRDLNWQTVRPSSVDAVEDLLQSPVLYVSGRDALSLPSEFPLLVRQYLDRGGFLLAEAACAGPGFDAEFREFMERVYPEPEYRLRPLDATHPAWRAERPVDLDLAPPLLGIEAGCRTSVIYCPQNLGCLWDLYRAGRGPERSPVVEAKVEAGLRLGLNILAYATNRELKYKDELPAFAAKSEQTELRFARGALTAAKLRHPGGCDAAPLAISALMRAIGENVGMPVEEEVRLISATDPALFEYQLLFMHGRGAFSLSELERQRLKEFLERGGVLIADAICGDPAFAESFAREMKVIFPDESLAPIPSDHEMFSSALGGADATKLRRRVSQGGGDGPLRTETVQAAPVIDGLHLGDRYAVLFSRFDFSCALESTQTLECPGYERADAAKLAINLVLYAMQQ